MHPETYDFSTLLNYVTTSTTGILSLEGKVIRVVSFKVRELLVLYGFDFVNPRKLLN